MKVYEIVAERIMDQLKKGIVPWRQPWVSAINYVSRKAYQGTNRLLLPKSGEYLTERQIRERSGTIKAGAKKHMVVFMKPKDIETKEIADEETGESVTLIDGNSLTRPPILRYYYVYHLEDIEGIPSKIQPANYSADSLTVIDTFENGMPKHPKAETIITGYQFPPKIKTGNGNKASYSPHSDTVTMPPVDTFTSMQGYYETMLHELIHSTGHSDRVEPYGLDEAFVDLSVIAKNFEQGAKLASWIQKRIQLELGISVSVGVANNKIMAKLGSDYKKPSGLTVITPEDYPRIVWPLPVSDLLYVGPATTEKLYRWGIYTIGDLAQRPLKDIEYLLGKNGTMIWTFANGLDKSSVAPTGSVADMKSIGNSTTTPRDLVCEDDVKMTVYSLAESVAERLREHGFRARTVELWIRDNKLYSFTRQMKIGKPSYISDEIAAVSMSLFRANHNFDYQRPIRSMGVRATDLVTRNNVQLSFFEEAETTRVKHEQLEHSIDEIRRRYGHFAIQRGMMLLDRKLTNFSPKEDHHQIFPVAYHK